MLFKGCAMELVSDRCILRLLDGVVEVKPTYILLFLEIKSPKGHLNWYITLVFCKTRIEGEKFFNDYVGGFKFIIVYDKFYFLLGSVGSMFPWISVFLYIFFINFIIVVHLVAIKKFDKCLLTGWSGTVFILLFNIFNHTFNLFINNLFRKLVID